MKISDGGETFLINKIQEYFPLDEQPGIIGMGDDTAVIPFNETSSYLVTTDMLVENTHFLRQNISAFDLGHKSLAANLSDISAMGGKSLYAFLSLGVPADTEVEWLESFLKGIADLARAEDVKLLGGDTVRSNDRIVVNFTVVGIAPKDFIKYRSGAKPSDYICVTGFLGDAAAGLKLVLENRRTYSADENYLIHAHHHPSPALQEGPWLASQNGVHAMMDLSDGVNADVQRILELSRCGGKIQLEQLPISAPLLRVAAKYNWNTVELATLGGEDYSLIITVDPKAYMVLKEDFRKHFARNLSVIGQIIEDPKNLIYFLNEKLYQFKTPGWSHF